MTDTPQPRPSRPPIDPRVERRTLTIVIGFFGLGILLAVAWISREIRRVSRIERVPPAALSSNAPSNTNGTPNTNTPSTPRP